MKYRFFQNCITYNEVADYLTEKNMVSFRPHDCKYHSHTWNAVECWKRFVRRHFETGVEGSYGYAKNWII